MEHLRKALTHYLCPKWALDRVEKRLTKPTSEVSNGVNNQGTTGAQPTTNEVKTEGHVVYAKASRRFAVGMAYRPTSKVKAPLKTTGLPHRTRTLWKTKVEPYTGSNVGTLHVMRNTYGKPLGPLQKESKNT